MCACGCFLLVGIVAAIVYCIIHALWLALAGVVLFAGILGWLGRKTIR